MRNEIKFCAPYTTLREIIAKKSLGPLYPARVINSIYYDTPELRDFHESEEGSVPRQKVRFRWYGSSISLPSVFSGNIEIKQTFANHRDKQVIKVTGLTWQELNKFITNTIEPELEPNVLVSYSREYFTNAKKTTRYTLDSRISFRTVDKNGRISSPKPDHRNVMELKVPTSFDYTAEASGIMDLHSRFSKYCEAIRTLELD